MTTAQAPTSPQPQNPEQRRRRRGHPPPSTDDLEVIRQKIMRLLNALDRSFMERSTHVRMTLLAILAGHHVLLLGPPGTAKSLLARAVCECFLGTRFFEYLLSKFSHPDELFGPVSIPGLKEEDYRRLTEGYLPRAHIAFLDEIFKANSAILNSLLTLINERVFHHGKHRDEVPLIGLVGASNEPPDPEGGLGALYDRFLVRLPVPPIAEGDNFLKVCLGDVPRFRPPNADRLSEEDIKTVRRAARSVKANDEVRASILRIRAKLEEAKIAASDRRWRWAVELLKMAAITSGRTEISLVDLVLLEHCFGDPGVDQAMVSKHVRESLGSPAELDTLLAPLAETWKAETSKPLPASFESWQRAAEATNLVLTAALNETQQALDQQVEEIEATIASTPWQTAAPPQVLARMTSLRAQFLEYQNAARAYSDASRTYSPEASIVRWQRARAEERKRSYWHGHDAGVVRVRPSVSGPHFDLDDEGEIAQQPLRGDLAKDFIELSDDTAYTFLTQPTPDRLAKEWSKVLAEALNAEVKQRKAKPKGKSRSMYGIQPIQIGTTPVGKDFAAATIKAWISKLRATPELGPPILATPPSASTKPSNGIKRR